MPPPWPLPPEPEVLDPPSAWLSLNVLSRMVRAAAACTIPPPCAVPPAVAAARLAATPQSLSVSVPELKIPPPYGLAVGDRQAGDRDICSPRDLEDPAGIVSTDGQPAGARAVDSEALADRPARRWSG